jgi:hypothetical protein
VEQRHDAKQDEKIRGNFPKKELAVPGVAAQFRETPIEGLRKDANHWVHGVSRRKSET